MIIRKAVVIIPYIMEKGERKYLVLERAIHWEGWEFPKGGIDKGEKDEEAAVRELKEETGLDAKSIERLPDKIVYYYQREGSRIRTEQNVFLAEVASKDVVISGEHKGFRWLAREDAIKQLTWKDQKDLIRNML